MTRGGEFDILIKLSRGEQERARLGTAANLENDTEKREKSVYPSVRRTEEGSARGKREQSDSERETPGGRRKQESFGELECGGSLTGEGLNIRV